MLDVPVLAPVAVRVAGWVAAKVVLVVAVEGEASFRTGLAVATVAQEDV